MELEMAVIGFLFLNIVAVQFIPLIGIPPAAGKSANCTSFIFLKLP
jgi:hypothetical protein